MGAPKPTKRKFSPGKTAAIQAKREATAAQSAPGADYQAERAAKKAAAAKGGGSYYGAKDNRAEEKEKGKARIAKNRAMLAKLRAKRQARSPMPTMGS